MKEDYGWIKKGKKVMGFFFFFVHLIKGKEL